MVLCLAVVKSTLHHAVRQSRAQLVFCFRGTEHKRSATSQKKQLIPREQDADLALFPLNRIEQTVEVVEIGRVTAHAGHVSANQLDGLIERLLPPTRDENVGTFFNAALGARQRRSIHR